jgi:hypothetical protein
MKAIPFFPFILSLLFPVLLKCQNYPVFNIPDSLKSHANAVIRVDSHLLEMNKVDEATFSINKVVTVLNRNGEKAGQFSLYYNSFNVPGDIRIVIYNAFGNQVKKVKQNEIYDHSISDDLTLLMDSRQMEYNPVINEYPYTVSIEYTLHIKGFTNLPLYSPVEDFGISVEHSSFTLTTKPGIEVRYHMMNFDSLYTTFTQSAQKFEWSVNGYPAIVKEPLAVDIGLVSPLVLLAPNQFEYDGSKGDFTSWKTYGEWLIRLLEGRDRLAEKSRQHVHALTDTIPDTYNKARVLYAYMQSRMRYISIQLGIGGQQPFPAESVDKLGYGDCKALSNYYIALLREAGIPALYAETKMNEGKTFFLEDFPGNLYFNHVVVCIPMQKDSIWAECTSSFVPFGFMGEDVAGHPSLLVTPGGGKIVHIPSGKPEDNKECRKYLMAVNPDGSAQMNIKIRYSGLKLEEGLVNYVQSKKEQEEDLYKELEMNDFIIDHLAYAYDPSRFPSISLEAGITCNKFAAITGNRMFLPSMLAGDIVHPTSKADARKVPFELPSSSTETDSLTYEIPQGFSLESIPQSFSAATKFGAFSLSYSQDGKTITITQVLSIVGGVYAASDYSDFRDFLISVQKAEKQKILLKQI